MTAPSPVYAWPTNTLYIKGNEGKVTKCEVYSFLGMKGKKLDIYRRITRVSDGAYQTLKAWKEYKSRLYADQRCKLITNISISGHWNIISVDSTTS
jgi:hypothetical protein